MYRVPARRMLIAAFALASAALTVHRVDADCEFFTPNAGGTGAIATPTSPIGQSFVACQDGIITNLAVWVGPSTVAPVRLGLQAGTDLLATDYSQMGLITPDARRVRFTTTFAVTNGMVYSLSLTPASESSTCLRS